MKASWVQTLIPLWIALSLPEWHSYGQKFQDEARKITLTTVQSKAATITQRYICQIHSHRHIEVRALSEGQLVAIPVREGQRVKRGDLLFQVGPPMDRQEPDIENQDKVVSIKAPFEGLIGRLLRQQGSFVMKGDALATLADNTVMWVYFQVPEKR
jgi:membrane fusion protein (multidrug efflux system)